MLCFVFVETYGCPFLCCPLAKLCFVLLSLYQLKLLHGSIEVSRYMHTRNVFLDTFLICGLGILAVAFSDPSVLIALFDVLHHKLT